MTIKLGEKVTDIVTGVTGIAVARVEYLNGCVQFCVQPKGALDALKTDSLYIDQGQLKRVGAGITAVVERGKGGPSAHTPSGMGRR